jgi:hypothetical protein
MFESHYSSQEGCASNSKQSRILWSNPLENLNLGHVFPTHVLQVWFRLEEPQFCGVCKQVKPSFMHRILSFENSHKENLLMWGLFVSLQLWCQRLLCQKCQWVVLDASWLYLRFNIRCETYWGTWLLNPPTLSSCTIPMTLRHRSSRDHIPDCRRKQIVKCHWMKHECVPCHRYHWITHGRTRFLTMSYQASSRSDNRCLRQNQWVGGEPHFMVHY